MRTTVDIDDKLFRDIKIQVAKQGLTLKQFVEEALQRQLVRAWAKGPQERIQFRAVASTSGQSGLPLTNEQIAEILDAEEIERAIALSRGR